MISTKGFGQRLRNPNWNADPVNNSTLHAVKITHPALVSTESGSEVTVLPAGTTVMTSCDTAFPSCNQQGKTYLTNNPDFFVSSNEPYVAIEGNTLPAPVAQPIGARLLETSRQVQIDDTGLAPSIYRRRTFL